jgi:hypothetical protein
MIHVTSTFSSLLTFRVWYKISPGWSVLHVCQSSCHLNILLSVPWKHTGPKVQLSLILNSALDNSCGQLHASSTLLPGRNQYMHWNGACVISRAILGDVLFIFRPSLYSDIWQYINSRFVVQCEDVMYSASQKSLCICTQLIRNIPQNELSCVFTNTSGKHLQLYKHMAIILAVTWVGMRNVLCCVVDFEFAESLQEALSLYINSMGGWQGSASHEACSVYANWTKATVTNYQFCLFCVLHWVEHISLHHSRKIGVKMNLIQTFFVLIQNQS